MHLAFEGVSFGYEGQRTIADVSFKAPTGGVLAVVGPSGAGKTTLAKLAAGLLRPSAGTVHFAGSAARPTMAAFAFQEAQLLDWLSCIENVLIWRAASGKRPSQADRAEATRLLLSLGLEQSELAKRPEALSVGMKARVNLARALFSQRALLVLDEPFAALDFVAIERVVRALDIWRHAKTEGLILLVTHDLRWAAQLADFTLLVSPGGAVRLEAFGAKPSNDEELNDREKRMRSAFVERPITESSSLTPQSGAAPSR